MGYPVAHLVKALRYMPEGGGFPTGSSRILIEIILCDRSRALGSTQHITEVSTRDLPFGAGVKATGA